MEDRGRMRGPPAGQVTCRWRGVPQPPMPSLNQPEPQRPSPLAWLVIAWNPHDADSAMYPVSFGVCVLLCVLMLYLIFRFSF